jgi:uncharacterized membrane protein
MDLLTILSRWAHIIAAVTAVGGAFFMRLVLLPAARDTLSDENHGQLQQAVLKRWKMIVHTAIALLIISGGYNLYLSMQDHISQGTYHMIFGVKLLGALAVFFLAIALTGKSAAFAPIRQQRIRWTGIVCVLGLLIIMLSGILRYFPDPQQTTVVEPAPTATTAPEESS